MEIKVILEEADVRKDFFTSNCKENNLKCPLCGEKIEHIKDGWCNCKNRCTGSGSISLWQELIRTKKQLETYHEFITKLYLNGNITGEHLERLIKALEQKE